ncbi:MAG TPA: glucokinase [Gammaproteobacteria bacterium]|jgi:glucokinase
MDLIADIGATNSRCALLDDRGQVVSAQTFENQGFQRLEDVLEAYLEKRRASDRPRRAALAVAAPVLGDDVQMLNIDWRFSQAQLREDLGFTRLNVVNDFAAVAWSLPSLGPQDRTQVGGGTAITRMPLAVIGPGTGLGVASLVPTGDTWAAVSGEGGHVTLPATTSEEASVIDRVRHETGHCSAERVLCGPGLVRLYELLGKSAGREVAKVTSMDVTGLARKGEPLATKTLAMFFGMLGTVAGNLALTVGARGGVFIGGGIVPHLLREFEASPFRERFVAKGRYREYMESIPTFVITEPLAAFRGLRKLLGYR